MSTLKKDFLDRINSLSVGERAALRRNAGCLLRNADGRAITAFYRCLPSVIEKRQEDRWFAIACLRCLWPNDVEGGKPFEQILSELIQSDNISDSTKHRVELLLDTEWDTDGYTLIKLTRLVKLICQKSDRSFIDFDALLDDLIYWNSENQRVQRKWAKTIFSTHQTTETEDK